LDNGCKTLFDHGLELMLLAEETMDSTGIKGYYKGMYVPEARYREGITKWLMQSAPEVFWN